MTTSAQWMSIKEAAAVTKRHRMTIWRWVEAGYVRTLTTPGSRRVLVRRSDITETERVLFDGEIPAKRT